MLKRRLATESAFCYICLIMNTKGRNTELISQRNHKLCARFYWYSEILNIRFKKTLKFLNEEFDLSEARIAQLLRENTDIIADFEDSKISAAELEKLYPHFNWNFNFLFGKKSPTAALRF